MTPYLEAFIRLFYPCFCETCGKPLETRERALCPGCAEGLKTFRLSLDDTHTDLGAPETGQSWALYSYEGPVRQLLGACKFSDKPWILEAFRQSLQETAALIRSEVRHDLAIPMPGGDLTSPLTGILAAQLQISVCNTTLIKKNRYPQRLLNREQRQFNLLGAFHIRKPETIRGRSVLLVDDIGTTGSTAREAAACLKEAGAKNVDLLVLARTPEAGQSVEEVSFS